MVLHTHHTKSMLSIFSLWSMMAPGFWIISPVLWSAILESIKENLWTAGNMPTNLKHLVFVMSFNSITLITLPYFTLEDWVIGHSVYIIHKILSRQKRRMKAFKQAKGVCRYVFFGKGRWGAGPPMGPDQSPAGRTRRKVPGKIYVFGSDGTPWNT